MALLDRVIFLPAQDGAGDFQESAAVTGYQTMEAAGAVDGQTYSYAAQTVAGNGAITAWEVGQGAWTLATRTLARTTVLYSSTGSKINFTSPPQVMITALAGDLSSGNTYYVGTGQKFTTIAQVNAASFEPGDSILFQGGQTFSGAIVCPSAGTPAKPIIFGSYGGGQATISSGNSNGFTSTNQAGIIVRDLTFTGTASTNHGIYFNNALGTGVHLQNIQVINCNVSGYGQNGIFATGSANGSGYDDVVIDGCIVSSCCTVATGLGSAGILIQNQNAFGLAVSAASFSNVTVRNCISHDNTGVTDTLWTGSGIVLMEVSGGLVYGCRAYNNGAGASGTVGIWTVDSNNITIDACISHNNLSATSADGDGFDIDEGCQNCVIQNCYSYSNFGCGFLMLGKLDNPATTTTDHCSFINCVSENDGQGSGATNKACIALSCAAANYLTNVTVSGCKMYQNGANTYVLLIEGSQAATITGNINENTFCQTVASIKSVFCSVIPSSSLIFNGNLYYSAIGSSFPAFATNINGVQYNDLASWNAADNTKENATLLNALSLSVGSMFMGPNFYQTEVVATGDVYANLNNNGPTYFMSYGTGANGSTSSYFYIGRNGTSLTSTPTPQFFFIAETGILGFGGATSSFPGLLNSGTTLQVKLADNSALAPLEVGLLQIGGTDTGISRGAANFIYFGNGTPGDFSATTAAGSFIIEGTSTPLISNNLSATDFTNTLNLLVPNLGTNQHCSFNLGVANSSFNLATFFFFYAGDGSVNNEFGVTFFGQSPVFKVAASGSVILGPGSALATNATDGFTYIQTCAGTPTGTPTTQTGTVPLVYDTTNNQLWIYAGGAWKQPKTLVGAGVVDWQ